MALTAGHRFAVSMAEAFPFGLYAIDVQEAQDYDEKTGRLSPAKDKVTGQRVYAVACMDREPEARAHEVKIKVLADVMPALPQELVEGSGIRPVEFTGLVVTPYIEEGAPGRRPRLAMSYRATGMWPQGKAPTASTPGRSGGLAPAEKPADHKAA
jgi:hypothetical protein